MQFRAAMTYTFTALACAAMLGCGGTSTSGPGTMSVHLVDGPEPGYSAILLQVKKLEIHRDTGEWETLNDWTTTKKGVFEVDLLSLRGVDNKGVPIKATLVDGKALPEGHYDEMRMLLGPGNTVTLSDGSVEPLKVPSGMQSGVKFPVSFDVAANTTRDVFIDMDAHRSIFLHQTGGSSPKYLLRPVIHAVDRLVTGYITGRLTASADKTGLAGVDVMAETSDGTHPVVVRTVKTGTDGTYVLDLLPAGSSYFVVAQPVTVTTATPAVTTVYAPKTSNAIAISETAPQGAYDASFDAVSAASVGSVSGAITPVAGTDQVDTVLAMATFTTTNGSASGPTKLVVRTVQAQVNAVTPATETYAIASLPLVEGGYVLAVERGTDDGSGGTTFAWKDDTGAPFLTKTATAPLDLTSRNLTAP